MTTTAQQRLGYELTEKEMFAQSNLIIKKYLDGRNKTLEIIQRNYGKYLVDVDPADYYTVLNQYQRLQKMNKEIQGVFIKTSTGSGTAVKKQLELAFTNNYFRQQYSTTLATSTIGQTINFTGLNPAALQASVYSDLTLWTTIRNEALKKAIPQLIPTSGTTLTTLLTENRRKELISLTRSLKSALIGGESYTKTAKRVKKVFDNSVSNTMRVLRTEGNRNLNAGALWNTEEARSQGIEIQRQWIATLDASTRATHQSADGQKEDKNGLFTVGGLKGRYPGDIPSPAESANCRCSTIDTMDGVSPELRRARDPVTGESDIISYKNYDQWMKGNSYSKDSNGKWVKAR